MVIFEVMSFNLWCISGPELSQQGTVETKWKAEAEQKYKRMKISLLPLVENGCKKMTQQES